MLLKYKGEGQLLPRNGDGMGRVGLFGKMQGLRFGSGILDYATNVDTIRAEYTVVAGLSGASGKG